jgi:hypothetical protein
MNYAWWNLAKSSASHLLSVRNGLRTLYQLLYVLPHREVAEGVQGFLVLICILDIHISCRQGFRECYVVPCLQRDRHTTGQFHQGADLSTFEQTQCLAYARLRNRMKGRFL